MYLDIGWTCGGVAQSFCAERNVAKTA